MGSWTRCVSEQMGLVVVEGSINITGHLLCHDKYFHKCIMCVSLWGRKGFAQCGGWYSHCLDED